MQFISKKILILCLACSSVFPVAAFSDDTWRPTLYSSPADLGATNDDVSAYGAAHGVFQLAVWSGKSWDNGNGLWMTYIASCPAGTSYVSGISDASFNAPNVNVTQCLCFKNRKACPRNMFPVDNTGAISWVKCKVNMDAGYAVQFISSYEEAPPSPNQYGVKLKGDFTYVNYINPYTKRNNWIVTTDVPNYPVERLFVPKAIYFSECLNKPGTLRF